MSIYTFATSTPQGGQCLLTLIPARDGRLVVIATEPEDNKGMSVTHAAEELATEFLRRFQSADPKDLVWIEKYEAQPYDLDVVTFKWDPATKRLHSPNWRRITDEERNELDLPCEKGQGPYGRA